MYPTDIKTILEFPATSQLAGMTYTYTCNIYVYSDYIYKMIYTPPLKLYPPLTVQGNFFVIGSPKCLGLGFSFSKEEQMCFMLKYDGERIRATKCCENYLSWEERSKSEVFAL